MRHPLARLPFDGLVPVGIAATIFAFACGSSSVRAANEAGKTVRWVMLFVLLALAAGWVLARGVRPRIHGSVAWAALAFLVLAAVSSLWSVDPRLSFARAGAFALVLAAATLLACGSAPERVLASVVGGASAVALAGLVVLAVDHADAVVPASIEVPSRFRGFGEDPNSAPLLLALGVPVALAAVLGAQRLLVRAAAAAALALLACSIVASGSRGALVGAAVGSLLAGIGTARTLRGRAVTAAAIVAALALGAYITSIPQPLPIQPAPAAAAPAQPVQPPRYADVDRAYPLDADIGRPLPGGGEPVVRRTFFGGSGRGQAWAGAIDQAAERPLLGYGFGTEGKVFVDRYYRFVGGLPEDSYIGIALQLGVAGLVALLALFTALALAGRAALATPRRHVASAALGVVATGAAMAVVQSYLYSPGNLASAAFWIAAFVPAATRERGG